MAIFDILDAQTIHTILDIFADNARMQKFHKIILSIGFFCLHLTPDFLSQVNTFDGVSIRHSY
jgi:hypothetical protein